MTAPNKTATNKRRDRIVRAARKAVRRKAPDKNLAPEDIRKLKIQTAHPALRALLFAGGCGCLILSVFVWGDHATRVTLAILFASAGLLLCLVGVVGHKKTVDDVLTSFGDAAAHQMIDRILDGLF